MALLRSVPDMKEIKVSELIENNSYNFESFEIIDKWPQNTEFWHYTSLNKIDSILQNKSLWLFPMTQSNDLKERNFFKKYYKEHNNSRIYTFCFCQTSTEKIPMWYLYGGICGNGGSIGITSKTMVKLILSIRENGVYGVSKDSAECCNMVVNDNNFKCGWVYYSKGDKSGIVKNKGHLYNIEGDINQIEKYLIKDYPWEYEKEFRLVIISDGNKDYDHFEIKLCDEVYKKIKIKLAPEISQKESNQTVLDIKKYCETNKIKIMNSDLKINMDLLHRNKDDIIDNISNIIDEKESLEICKVVQNKKYCIEKENTNK